VIQEDAHTLIVTNLFVLLWLQTNTATTKLWRFGEYLKTKRKTEINLEIEESVAISQQRVLLAYCRRCRKQTRMFAANEAAMIAGLTARALYRLVECGRLHFIEDRGGMLYVCSESLKSLRDSSVDL
jgi:hypothetical protein